MPGAVPNTQSNIPDAPAGSYTGPGPTSNIPGSNVMENTGLRQRVLPAPAMGQQGWQDKINDLIRFAAAGLGDVYRPPGMKTGAGLKEVQQMQALRDEKAARQSMGYIARLQALAVTDPSKAQDAMLDLGDFVTANAEHIPLPVLSLAQASMGQLKAVDQQYKTKQVFTELASSPTAPERVKEYNQLIQADVPHEVARMFVKEISDRAIKRQIVQTKDGRVLSVNPEDPADWVELNLGMSKLPGEPLTIENIPKEVRAEYGKAMVNVAAAVSAYNKNDPTALAIHREMIIRAEKAAKELKDEPKRLQLTADQLSWARVAGVDPKKQFWDQLTDGDAASLKRAQDANQDRDSLQQAMFKGQVVPYTPMGRPAPAGRAEDIIAGRLRGVPAEAVKSLRDTMGLEAQVEKLGHVASKVLVAGGAGSNWVNAIKMAVGRNLLGSEDREHMALFTAMKGELGLQLTKLFQGSRPSDLDLKTAMLIMPSETDSVGLAKKKIAFLQYQLGLTRQAILEPYGIATVPTYNKADLIAAFPELAGQINASAAMAGQLGGGEAAPSFKTKAGGRIE